MTDNIVIKCKAQLNGTFWVPLCQKNFQSRFYLICFAKCNTGLIDNGEYCYKRKGVHLANPVVFNFNDLFN